MLALFGAATPPKEPKPSPVSPSAYMQVLTLPAFFTDNDTTPAPVCLVPPQARSQRPASAAAAAAAAAAAVTTTTARDD